MSGVLAEADRKRLREELEARFHSLRVGIEAERGVARSERIGQYAGEVHDRGEESSVDAAAEVNDAIIDQHEAELRAVRLALGRIEDGTYGECATCGGEIGLRRLEAWPAAARCLPCQERSEGAAG